MTYTLGEIANRIQARLEGDPACIIDGVSTLKNSSAGKISFLADRVYYQYLKNTKASAVILNEKYSRNYCPAHCLVVDNPCLSYIKVVELFYPEPVSLPGIDASAKICPTASIHRSSQIDANVVIGKNVKIASHCKIAAGCVIGDNVVIEDHTKIHANVVICQGVKIGKHVILHPGVIIGADGFGLTDEQGVWRKIPQIGSVTIGDYVEIGANSTIDCGAIENTVLEEGVKIDNQVQIGHNVHIGAHTAIAGCTGIAGSTIIGKHCQIGGACVINGHIKIADHVTIYGASQIAKSINKAGQYASAIPESDAKIWRKNIAVFRKLYKFHKRLMGIEKKIDKNR